MVTSQTYDACLPKRLVVTRRYQDANLSWVDHLGRHPGVRHAADLAADPGAEELRLEEVPGLGVPGHKATARLATVHRATRP